MTALSSLITPVSGTSTIWHDEFTATASQTIFATTLNFTPSQIDVYQNGVKLINGVDVTVTSGTGFTLAVGATLNDKISAVYYYLNATTPTPAPLAAYGAMNIIINGGMEVSQVNGTSGVVAAGGSGNYTVDQWMTAIHGTMVCTAQQVTDAPPGYNNSLKITVGTAESSIAAADYLEIFSQIEGFRTSKLSFGNANAQTFTLGFWTKIHRTGTYSGSLRNAIPDRSYIFTFTQNVADTWEYKTVVIPADVTGTWVGNTNGVGLNVQFCMASGTNFTSTANTWTTGNLLGVTGTTNGVAATSDVFQLTGVTLFPGSLNISSTMAPNFIRPYSEELTLCMRYFEYQGTGTINVIRAQVASCQVFDWVSWVVEKRVQPTITLINPVYSQGSSGSLFNASTNGYEVTFSSSSGSPLAGVSYMTYGISGDARF